MKRPLFWLSLFLSGLMALFAFVFYQNRNGRDDFSQTEGSFITVSGTIRDIEERENSEYLVTISNLQIQAESAIKSPDFITKFIIRNPKVLCYCTSEADKLKIGQEVILAGSYAGFKRAQNPGEFDLRKYYFSKGYLFSLRDAHVVRASAAYSYSGELLWKIKKGIRLAFLESLDEESAGVMIAMFLGDRSGLSKELKEEYNETGIAHILAISGLHISILGAFLYLLLDRVPMKPWIRVLCLFGFLVCYAYMVGLGVSVIRAAVCFLLRKLALIVGRSSDSLTNLGIASFVTLLICPAMLLSSSYLLSYLAVAGLTLLSEDFLSRKFPLEHPVWNRLLSGFAISFITLPVIMGSYYSVPVYSIPLNLLVLPFVPYLFGCGGGVLMFYYLAKLISGWNADVLHEIGYAGNGLSGISEINVVNRISGIIGISEMDGIMGVSLLRNVRIIGAAISQGMCKLCAFFIQSILAVFRMMNAVSLSLPHGRIVTGARPLWRVLVFFILVALLAYISGHVRKWIYLGYLRTEIAFKLYRKKYIRERQGLRKQEIRFHFLQGCMILCLILFLFLPCHKSFRVTFLDVGQGDGIIIEDGRRTYVIDGGRSSKNELGKYVLIPALEYRGINKVDVWFVTHPDKDHISGLLDVLDDGKIEIDCIYVPQCLKEELMEAMENAGETEIGQVRIERNDVEQTSTEKTGEGQIGREVSYTEKFGAGKFSTGLSNTGKFGAKKFGIGRINAGSFRTGINEPEIKGLCQGEKLSDGKISFTVLSPLPEGVSEDTNGNSLVLLMEKKGFRFLFMGDAGETAEREIINNGIAEVDVLKVGHHGSAVNTNGEEFLSFIKPKVAVISCGINNRYGHPHAETLERLEEIGAYIFRTDENGAVTVKVKGRKMEVIGFLD